MPVELGNIANTTSFEPAQSESSYSEVNQLNYALKEMATNAFSKSEIFSQVDSLNKLSNDVFNEAQKQVVNQIAASYFGVSGLNVNMTV